MRRGFNNAAAGRHQNQVSTSVFDRQGNRGLSTRVAGTFTEFTKQGIQNVLGVAKGPFCMSEGAVFRD